MRQYKCTACIYSHINACDHVTRYCIMDSIGYNHNIDNTPENFIFNQDPALYLKYIAYTQKNNIPELNEKALLLRPNYNANIYTRLTVSEINDHTIKLSTFDNKTVIIPRKYWYNHVVILKHKEEV